MACAHKVKDYKSDKAKYASVCMYLCESQKQAENMKNENVNVSVEHLHTYVHTTATAGNEVEV